jgi:hypothetical protein
MAAVEDIRPYLRTGLPEYNIPSLEPLVMQDLISEEVAGMKIVTSHVSAYGCSDFFVRGIEYLCLNNILQHNYHKIIFQN